MNIQWDAEKYKEDFSFVHRYGEDVLNLIDKPDREESPTAVDLGCGNGALSMKLAEKGFSVIGIDDSDEMLGIARKLYPKLDFRKGNAVDFSLGEKADVIFSNAVFHWINAADQEKLLGNIFRNLKAGGRLVCEFGGKGCAESVHGTLERLFGKRGLSYPRTFYFPTIGEYAPIAEKAGFRVEYACLFDRPTPQKGEHGLAEWIEMFIKKTFEGMSREDKDAIVRECEDELKGKLFRSGQWFVDYVRIRIKAVKPIIGG